MTNKSFFISAIYFVLAAVAYTQDKPVVEPPELIARREEHLRSMQRVAVPVLGTYIRTLESLKAQYTREGKLDAALAVDTELKTAKQQYDTANNAASRPTGAAMQLTVLSASFGDPKTRRMLDVTKVVQKAFASGQASMKLGGEELAPGQDPAPRVHKSVTIEYYINGQRKQKVFQAGDVVNFHNELQ